HVTGAALHEVANGYLHAVECRLDVHRDHLVDVVVAQIDDRTRNAASGVVDPDVERFELGERGITQRLDVGTTCDVHGYNERTGSAAPLGFGGYRPQLGFASGRKHETIAIGGESVRQPGTDAATRAGDD